MTVESFAPPYDVILDELSQSRVIPFLGAGASLGAYQENPASSIMIRHLPTARELAAHLARKTQFPQKESESLDLAKVAQFYRVMNGRDTLQRELHRFFDHDYPLTPLHTFLADVPVPLLIVTTNYDDLIERAFKLKGRPYDVVIHKCDSRNGRIYWWPFAAREPKEVKPRDLDLDFEKTTVIYKMHGAVDRGQSERDQYVITEDDYIDFLSRLITKTAVPQIFSRQFETRHFLFLGYGLRDWNFRVVLNRIDENKANVARSFRDIRSWAIQQAPSELDQRLWGDRGVNVYDISLDEFVENLLMRREEG